MIVDITCHQHLPSDSLDLLELPQGPALLSACLDWGLPRLAHLQLLAALLAEAPERFPLEQHAFVGELLLAAAAVWSAAAAAKERPGAARTARINTTPPLAGS